MSLPGSWTQKVYREEKISKNQDQKQLSKSEKHRKEQLQQRSKMDSSMGWDKIGKQEPNSD